MDLIQSVPKAIVMALHDRITRLSSGHNVHTKVRLCAENDF